MLNSTIENQVFKTKEYDLFHTIAGNRKINSRNYTKIANSMKEKQLLIPIIVNEKMQIIDGQHRFTACKELGLPVFYIIVNGYGLEEVERANTASATWDKLNFLDMHISKGNENYIEFNSLLVRYGINISELIKVFALVQGKNIPIANTNFEEGNFTLEGEEDVLNYLRALQDFSFFSEYKSSKFTTAFMKLFFYEKYNHKRMQAAIKVNGGSLVRKNSYSEYLALLTSEIYSKGKVKEPIYYDSSTDKFYI